LFSYILTSHERSCEQNGHGNTTERATIRFCFGGGFRLDFLFPILFNKKLIYSNKNLKKIKSTIIQTNKIKKIDFFVFFYFFLFFVFNFTSLLTSIGLA